MIKFVYGILPVFIKHVETMRKPESTAGYAKGCFIKIRTKFSFEIGLLHHEITHVKQWYRTLGLHSLLYMCFKWYKKLSETEAYRVQLKYVKNREKAIKIFTNAMVNKYGLGITVEEARKLFTK